MIVDTTPIGLIDTNPTDLNEEETKTIYTSTDLLSALTFAYCKMDEDSVEDHSKEQTNEITRKIESLEQLIAYPEPRNEVAMKVETSDTVVDNLVPNLSPVILHPEHQMEGFCHDEQEKNLNPVVNNLVVNHQLVIPYTEPGVEVISQEEIMQTNEVTTKIETLEQVIVYPEPHIVQINEVAMRVETSDTVENNLVRNLPPVIQNSEHQMKACCHDEKEKLLDPVVNNLEVAEPCVEVISQKEIIGTNEVAMSVDIASDFDQNQVSKSKFPVDTSENMDIWNEIDAIIEQADNEEDLVVAESIIQEVQTAVINPDVPEFPFVKSQDTSVSGENIDQNFTMEFQDGQKDYRKDNFSFSFKNALVLMRYDEKASSKQCEEFFKTMFPYYCTAPAGWEKSARHNLSETNGYFEKTNEAAPTIKGQRGPKGKLWTFSESKKEKLKKAMIKEWKAFGEDIKSTSACPTLVATLFKKILDSKTSETTPKITQKAKSSNFLKPSLTYFQLAVLAIKDSSKDSLIVSDMYKYCEKHFPYFKDMTDKRWQTDLRSNLAKKWKEGLLVKSFIFSKAKNGNDISTTCYSLAPKQKESEA